MLLNPNAQQKIVAPILILMSLVLSFSCETQFIRFCSPHRQKGGPAIHWTHLTAQLNQPIEGRTVG